MKRKRPARCVTEKVTYRSIERAEAEAAIMAIRYQKELRAYGCPQCGFYHLTSKADGTEYQPFDIRDTLLDAVACGEASMVERLQRGAVRYEYDGYVFRYVPNGRSEIVIERVSPS